MAELLIPEYLDGKPTFVPYAGDIQRLLKEGDPTIGWEGDPRLYITPMDRGGWAVGRLCEDGVKRMICHSTPDSNGQHKLDKSLLIQMRNNDTRKSDVLKRIETSNQRFEKDRTDAAVEKMSEALERVIHGIRADVGHHY